MRAKEFLNEIKLDIPNQMVTVQVPLSDVVANNISSKEKVINPGKRPDKNGNYKWSPPLQQHLDITKDAVGVSNDEINANDAEKEIDDEEALALKDLKNKLLTIFSNKQSMP